MLCVAAGRRKTILETEYRWGVMTNTHRFDPIFKGIVVISTRSAILVRFQRIRKCRQLQQKKLRMEKFRTTRHLLQRSSRSLLDRRLKLNSENSIHSSGTVFTRTCTGYRNWILPACLHPSRDCRGLTEANAMQNRYFGSVAELVQRSPSFSTLDSDDISFFKSILGEKNVVQDEDVLATANTDWMRKYKGSSKLLLQPRSTEEVSEILKYCNSRHLAVAPQGGNTGLVGGSVPVFDEDAREQSDWHLCALVNHSSFVMPLDLGAKGSCQIGGNVSTNAGGLRLVRYGSLHGNVLGLEAVLANGDVLDMLGTLRKDNTGYDLKHLFIGSEGSLGIVTKVSILTPPKLSSVNIAFLACKDYFSCQKLLQEAKRKLGEILSAFEFLDIEAMDLALNHLEGARNPLPASIHNFYVLIETTGSNESYDKEKLEAFLLSSMEGGLISDGVVAQDINQASSFWRIREGVPEALIKAGANYKYDLSLPVEKMYNLVEDMRARLGGLARVVAYGHLGDANLHLNVSAPKYDDKILAQIEPYVYEWTSKHRGSISAEHGLGLMKANKIFYSKSPKTVQLMTSIKNLLDPNGILNPYKVLPHSLNP
ncbi:hypothetical protein SLEP1_g49064 [Rubroshorea leprosula]|uniref:FAD-binding PCMH-type domain-containing protein n=1 Tax=Rubroshorea leprosula TaxID=152421 RepID=A0AAV5LVW5_9ROSI|nr:hypothetical protein SLEP1_g49064 [Rubroshorea leprosula]